MIKLDEKDIYGCVNKNNSDVISIALRQDKVEHWLIFNALYSNTPRSIHIDINLIEDQYQEEFGADYTKIQSFPCILIHGYAMTLDEYFRAVKDNKYVFDGVDLRKEQAELDAKHEEPEELEPLSGPLRAGIDYNPNDAKLSPEEEWEWFGQHGDD